MQSSHDHLQRGCDTKFEPNKILHAFICAKGKHIVTGKAQQAACTSHLVQKWNCRSVPASFSSSVSSAPIFSLCIWARPALLVPAKAYIFAYFVFCRHSRSVNCPRGYADAVAVSDHKGKKAVSDHKVKEAVSNHKEKDVHKSPWIKKRFLELSAIWKGK